MITNIILLEKQKLYFILNCFFENKKLYVFSFIFQLKNNNNNNYKIKKYNIQ